MVKKHGKMYSFSVRKDILSLEINRFGKTILQKPGICCIFDLL